MDSPAELRLNFEGGTAGTGLRTATARTENKLSVPPAASRNICKFVGTKDGDRAPDKETHGNIDHARWCKDLQVAIPPIYPMH